MSDTISINQDQPKFLVYKHINKVNNKVYIGITHHTNPKKRWQNGKGYRCQKHFYSAILQYGWENFDHEIIQENLSELDAELLEEKLIAEYDATNPEKGYNMSKSSVGGYNLLSEEAIQKISEANKGKKFSKKINLKKGKKGKDNYFYGKRYTGSSNHRWHNIEESKKVSEKLKGRKISQETRQKISNTEKNTKLCADNPSYGKHWYNNGVISIFDYNCPENFVPGNLNTKGKSKKGLNKGLNFYNNGIINVRSRECPDGFQRGRLNIQRNN